MEDESYPEQLIDALGQLRERVTQVSEGERTTMFLDVRIIFNKLPYPDTPEGRKREDELGLAIDAIHPDYSVETIDNAISVAVSQW